MPVRVFPGGAARTEAFQGSPCHIFTRERFIPLVILLKEKSI
jgi:hypothetical protein